MQRIKDVELFLFDMDGTLYLGNKLFEYTLPLLNTIKQQNKRYMFLTNNSSKSVADYILKLKKLGINATKEDFLTSSQATAYYLKNHHSGANIYVCGTKSLKEELKENGFTVTEDILNTDCIVMGNDSELTFKKLEDVCKILFEKDVPYIATNPDYVCPTEFGSVPDCGSVCDMIYNCTKKRPIFIGKPSELMPNLAMQAAGVSKEKTAVIGDRIYTDIKSGINSGALSILVLSGETTKKELEKSLDKPDIVLENCGEILKYM